MRIFLFLFLFITYPLFAKDLVDHKNISVFSKLGNIYYKIADGNPIRITSLGKDSLPVLSPDNKLIAFVRIGNEVIPEECDGDTETKYGNQIWIYNISTKKERLLVKNDFDCVKPEREIVDPHDFLFSPDNKLLYFITSAWTTSGALHSVRIDDEKLNYIAPANAFSVVTKGEDEGYLIVYQHRYFIGGGTYDWYWLLSPIGKEEGPIGPEITKDQMDFIESDA